MANDENIERWITMNGNHIPILKGETEEEAINKFIGKDYEKELDNGPLIKPTRVFYKGMEVYPSAISSIKKSGDISELKIEEEPLPKEPEFLKSYPKLKKSEDYSQAAKATNPNFDTHKYEWTYNCQRCVVAWEMRYRGYDVTAKPRLKDEEEFIFKHDTHWTKSFKDLEWDETPYYYPSDRKGNVDLIENTILNNKNPCGSRFIIRIQWKKPSWIQKSEWEKKPKGHVFIGIINDKNELEYYDPQSGKRAAWKKSASLKHTTWARIDNKELTENVFDCVYKKGEN